METQSIVPPLQPSTLEAVYALGFQDMTPVQAATIPLFLANKVRKEGAGGWTLVLEVVVGVVFPSVIFGFRS